MGCREHETDRSVFDVHHRKIEGERERKRERERGIADGLLLVTWTALVCLVFLVPAPPWDRLYVGKNNTTQKREKMKLNCLKGNSLF